MNSLNAITTKIQRQLYAQRDELAAAAAAAAATAATAAAAAAVSGAGAVEVAAQLTGLKQLLLRLKQSPQLTDPVLLQLTALTALEELRLQCHMEDEDDYRNILVLDNNVSVAPLKVLYHPCNTLLIL
jgi:ABC-type transporter Mla subunit MlaD